MTRRNVGYLPIYSRFQSTCHIRGMTSSAVRSTTLLSTFQSTCHIRGMTGRILPFRRRPRFQSTCHIRGMTFASRSAFLSSVFQSTCHIRGMTDPYIELGEKIAISIHMPHTWHDRAMLYGDWDVFISIHMPHTWHDDWRKERAEVGEISIHMPHTWHDLEGENILDPDYKFQSTCHIRGMTCR